MAETKIKPLGLDLTVDYAFTGGITFDSTTLTIDDDLNRVGIGTASPLTKLHIDSGDITISMGVGGNTGIIFRQFVTDAYELRHHGELSNNPLIMKYLPGGLELMTWNENGTVTKPSQPSFLVTAPTNTANITGDGTTATIEYDTEIFDQGDDFNTGTFTFTAPVAGRYFLQVACRFTTSTANGQTDAILRITTSNRTYFSLINQVPDSTAMLNFSVIADMDLSDTAIGTIQVSGGTKIVEPKNDASSVFFSGSLIN